MARSTGRFAGSDHQFCFCVNALSFSAMPVQRSLESAQACEACTQYAQACETCTQCGRTLTREFFWPDDWRFGMSKGVSSKCKGIKCKECCPTPRNERSAGFTGKNEQASLEATGKPITCQVCERSLPRSQFRKNNGNKFDFRKGMTCEQCRADGKLPTSGWKKRRIA